MVPAVILRRTDFRESSRIVTLLTRDHGRIVALAKGAHRPTSPFLGRLDYLNEVVATIGADRGGLRLMVTAELRRERRGLRSPERFTAAGHLGALCDFAMPAAHPEPPIFELLHGGLNLLEHCPPATIPVVVLGLELRFLSLLGALPALDRCAHCGDGVVDGAFVDEGGGIHCRRHAPLPRRAVPAEALALWHDLQRMPGRQWPELQPQRVTPAAVALPGTWLWAALGHAPRLRRAVFAAPTNTAAGTAAASTSPG